MLLNKSKQLLDFIYYIIYNNNREWFYNHEFAG